jgi:hypothetical protein
MEPRPLDGGDPGISPQAKCRLQRVRVAAHHDCKGNKVPSTPVRAHLCVRYLADGRPRSQRRAAYWDLVMVASRCGLRIAGGCVTKRVGG